MKTQTKITDKIRRAAEREAETWHDLCQMNYVYHGDVHAVRYLEKKWEVAREHLADAMRLRGDDRCRARLIFLEKSASALCKRTRNSPYDSPPSL
jgi:hypothetical protein